MERNITLYILTHFITKSKIDKGYIFMSYKFQWLTGTYFLNLFKIHTEIKQI